MSDFVEKAFADAEELANRKEFEAYVRTIDERSDIILTTAALRVGMDKMDKLAEAIVKSDQMETLDDFIRSLAITCFHLGFTEGRRSI